VDGKLSLSQGATREDLEKALKNHTRGQAEYMGKYKKGAGKAA